MHCVISKLRGLQLLRISEEQYFLTVGVLMAQEIRSPGPGKLTETNGDYKNICMNRTERVLECVFLSGYGG
jgi:hypothetical protein